MPVTKVVYLGCEPSANLVAQRRKNVQVKENNVYAATREPRLKKKRQLKKQRRCLYIANKMPKVAR